MSFRNIGQKIQAAREAKGISQEQLARALGCSQPALSNYEKGKRRLYLSHLEKLSAILDQPLEYFMENNPGESKEDNCTLAPALIKTITQLSPKQILEVQNFIAFILWKQSQGRQ